MSKALLPWTVSIPPEAFKAWMKAHSLKGADVARLFDLHPNTVTRYRRYGAPKSIEWACFGYSQHYMRADKAVKSVS